MGNGTPRVIGEGRYRRWTRAALVWVFRPNDSLHLIWLKIHPRMGKSLARAAPAIRGLHLRYL